MADTLFDNPAQSEQDKRKNLLGNLPQSLGYVDKAQDEMYSTSTPTNPFKQPFTQPTPDQQIATKTIGSIVNPLDNMKSNWGKLKTDWGDSKSGWLDKVGNIAGDVHNLTHPLSSAIEEQQRRSKLQHTGWTADDLGPANANGAQPLLPSWYKKQQAYSQSMSNNNLIADNSSLAKPPVNTFTPPAELPAIPLAGIEPIQAPAPVGQTPGATGGSVTGGIKKTQGIASMFA